MAVRFSIDQATRPAGVPDRTRHDLIAGQPIVLAAVEPAPGPGYTYAWKILDRAFSTATLSASSGNSVQIASTGAEPFAYLIEMRAYQDGEFVGVVSRIASAKTPGSTRLRIPLFGETADPASTFDSPNYTGSTDNAIYEDRAGLGSEGQNWRGWTELLQELTIAVAAVASPQGDVTADEGDPLLTRVRQLQGQPISAAVPEEGQALVWDDVEGHWKPQDATVPEDVVTGPGEADVGNLALWASDTAIADSGILATEVDDALTKLSGVETGAQVTSASRVLTALAAAAADVSVNSRKITNVATPAAGTDAANKQFVEDQIAAIPAGSVTGPVSSTTGNVAAFGDAGGDTIVDTGLAATALATKTYADDGDAGTLAAANAYTDDAIAALPPGGGGDLSDDPPLAVAAAADPGTDGFGARSDHVHAHGSQAGGALHSDVVAAGASGFMTGAQATKLDGVETAADVTDFANVAAALAAASGDIAVNARKITGLADPTAAQDAVTKAYADALGGGGGDWITAFDHDFAALANQTMADGANVIDGLTWTGVNIASGGSIVNVNGTALRLKGNASSTTINDTTRSGPHIKIALSSVLPANASLGTKIRLWLAFKVNDANNATELANLGLFCTTFVSGQDQVVQALAGRSGGTNVRRWDVFKNSSAGTSQGNEYVAIGSAAYNANLVKAVELENLARMEGLVYQHATDPATGVLPDARDLTLEGAFVPNRFSAADTAAGNGLFVNVRWTSLANVCVLLGCSTNNTANNTAFETLVYRAKLEYLL